MSTEAGGAAAREVHATMWEQRSGRWAALLDEPFTEVEADTRAGCLRRLRAVAGAAILLVEVIPPLAGVAEAAAILGWDKRRVITYLDRGAFPQPLIALASGRIWLREDVESFANAWHEKQARRKGEPDPVAASLRHHPAGSARG
ncbi:MAG: hypothetical protein WD206_03300 [Actinomycetota bacterium]